MKKKLFRSTEDAWLGGVFGGIAKHYDIEPTALRLLFIVAALILTGVPLFLIYIVAWMIMPKEVN